MPDPVSSLDIELDTALRRAREILRESERVVVLTGAGISTDSGIPDFRGPNGVWTKNPEAEKMATLHHWVNDPAVRRRGWRMKLEAAARKLVPNPGHLALVELERQGKLDLLLTQNVDGLHHDAGNDPARIVEVHGTMRECVCLSCGERGPIAHALDRVAAGEDDPACRECGGVLKSATISFGQSLVDEDLLRADEAARACECLLAIGTTLGVYPIASVVPLAKRGGARIVIVNGSPTEMDELADVVLRGSISEILPRLVATEA